METGNYRKVYIIGNGFDLNLGYPTRFRDFIYFCQNWESFYDRPDNEKYMNGNCEDNLDVLRLVPNQSEDQEQERIKSGMKNLKISLDDEVEKEDIKKLNELIRNNRFIAYLKTKIENKENIKNNRWADLENHLLELCEMCEEREELLLDFAGGLRSDEILDDNTEFKSFLRFVSVGNSFYSLTPPKKKYIVKSMIRNDKLKFIDIFYKKLQGFSEAYNLYLKLFVFKMKRLKFENISNDENTFVLDFNYTNFCREVFSKSNINYVHGHQHDNSIIIGITSDKLGSEYDILRKEYMRLNLLIRNKHINEMDLYGRYDDIDKFNSPIVDEETGSVREIQTYAIVIGHSLNKVDWDILTKYFKDKIFHKVYILYYNNYKSLSLNLYQMLKNSGIDAGTIEARIKEYYYDFKKFEDLKTMFPQLEKELEGLSRNKYLDLNDKEVKVLEK